MFSGREQCRYTNTLRTNTCPIHGDRVGKRKTKRGGERERGEACTSELRQYPELTDDKLSAKRQTERMRAAREGGWGWQRWRDAVKGTEDVCLMDTQGWKRERERERERRGRRRSKAGRDSHRWKFRSREFSPLRRPFARRDTVFFAAWTTRVDRFFRYPQKFSKSRRVELSFAGFNKQQVDSPVPRKRSIPSGREREVKKQRGGRGRCRRFVNYCLFLLASYRRFLFFRPFRAKKKSVAKLMPPGDFSLLPPRINATTPVIYSDWIILHRNCRIPFSPRPYFELFIALSEIASEPLSIIRLSMLGPRSQATGFSRSRNFFRAMLTTRDTVDCEFETAGWSTLSRREDSLNGSELSTVVATSNGRDLRW